MNHKFVDLGRVGKRRYTPNLESGIATGSCMFYSMGLSLGHGSIVSVTMALKVV